MNPFEVPSLPQCDLGEREVTITADDVRRITASLPRSYEMVIGLDAIDLYERALPPPCVEASR